MPSVGHEDVPYWCALVRGADGVGSIVKLDYAINVGETLRFGRHTEVDLEVVGILGTGVMGRGLAELLLARGHRVVLCGRSEDGLAAAKAKVLDRLGRVMDEEQVRQAECRLGVAVGYAELSSCDVVIEAVVEEMEPKKVALAQAEAHMRSDAILATNTSGLSIDDLANALQRPQNFGVLHFFNPANRMRLVETAIGGRTSPETAAFLDEFSRSLGKVPVRVAATPAFAVNRALMPLLNEAVRELEEGVADAEAIDEAVRLGLNHPMGPLALADLIGLDVVANIMTNLAERTGDDTYAPRPLLRKKIADGHLGRKSGQGFYVYER
ncbi:MAG: 3-hydroxybutyryl-CoA dehydrogenase [Actinobacteria bacterium HGW-Actinobacteria-7]|nr:MAG: 3-hydroxybutyryl-CoA dehydrogenase [Actinobacteria bacterium HGW-Actinobacteria-7]